MEVAEAIETAKLRLCFLDDDERILKEKIATLDAEKNAHKLFVGDRLAGNRLVELDSKDMESTSGREDLGNG
jgi:hypothetical protein